MQPIVAVCLRAMMVSLCCASIENQTGIMIMKSFQGRFVSRNSRKTCPSACLQGCYRK